MQTNADIFSLRLRPRFISRFDSRRSKVNIQMLKYLNICIERVSAVVVVVVAVIQRWQLHKIYRVNSLKFAFYRWKFNRFLRTFRFNQINGKYVCVRCTCLPCNQQKEITNPWLNKLLFLLFRTTLFGWISLNIVSLDRYCHDTLAHTYTKTTQSEATLWDSAKQRKWLKWIKNKTAFRNEMQINV